MSKRKENWITNKTRDLLKARKPHLWFLKCSDRFTLGLPDFIGVYKGRFFAIELKRPGLLARLLQKHVLKLIEGAGGATLSTDSLTEVNKFIGKLGRT